MTRPFPGPISSNILDDFKAPDETTKPYQDQLTRVRQAFGALDARWLAIKLVVLASLDLNNEEQLRIKDVQDALSNLNNAILNKTSDGQQVDQEPAKGSQTTV